MHRDSKKIVITAAISGAVFGITLAVAPAHAAPRVAVDIPAGPASETLITWTRETNLQMLFNFDDVSGIKTRPVSGNLEPLQALRELLVDTQLDFKPVGSKTVVVYRVPVIEIAGHPPVRGRTLRHPNETDPHDPSIVVIRSQAVRGEIPSMVGIDILMVGRDDIEKSGLTTTPELVNTLPQNFAGGPNENTTRGGAAESNSGSGAGLNLRGLSDDTTIVLVNGRRLAPSGTVGAFTDIANVPLAAIDHMEVIAEGATAQFGLDAVGGIVNFVTRHDEGLETEADVGGLARGAVYHERFNQSYGTRWDSGNLFALFEYYERDALPAARRALATSDLTAYGGQNFDSVYGNPGTIGTFTPGGGYTTWAIPRGQNGTALTPSQLVPNTRNLYDQLSDTTILPRQQLSSLVLSGGQDLTDSWSIFVDVLLSQRLARSATHSEEVPVSVRNSDPFYVNPLGGTEPITVFYHGFGPGSGPVLTHADVNTGQITAGVDHNGGIFDHLEFYTSYAYERQHQIQDGLVNPYALEAYINDPNPSTALNVFGDGSYTNPATLAAIRSQGSLGMTSRLQSANFTAYRLLFRTSGGSALLTVSDEYRKHSFESYDNVPAVASEPQAELARTTLSTFAQLRVPIIGTDSRRDGIESLELSTALRYEHYSDVGAATAPQFALAYSPVKRVLLRGTWARLFHPPDLPDLSEVSNSSTLYLLQTASGAYTTALIFNGNNAQLRPEAAKSWTAGVDVTPFENPTLALGLTYFHTDFTNRINGPTPLSLNVLQDPSLSWLLRPATPPEQTYVCQHTRFTGVPSDCLSAQPGAIVDLRLQNVASLDTQGLDIAAQYELDHAQSIWKLSMNATYVFQYAEQQTPSSSPRDLVSTDHHPIDLRLRVSLSWARRGLWARGFVNFQNSYQDIDSTPHRPISSWTTVDAVVGYDFRLGNPDSTEKTEFSISAHNLFNHQPPFLNSQYAIGYDQENASLLGRVISFDIRHHW